MTTERELLLLALSPATPDNAARIRTLAGSTPNWDELLWDTHWHRTTSVLGRALFAHARDQVPARVADLLRRHGRATATCALHQLQVLRKATQCLDAIGVSAAAGRGPLLAQVYHRDAAARDPVDVPELCVLPGDVDRASGALQSAGLCVLPGEDRRVDLRLRTHASRHAGIEIDRRMLHRAKTVSPAARILDRADMLFVMAASLASRPWGQAHRLADFVAVLLGATASDVEGAILRARTAQLETPLNMALGLAWDLPGAASTLLRASPSTAIDPALLEVSNRLLHGRARMSLADLNDHRRMVSAAPLADIEPEGSRDLGEFVPNDESIIDAMLDLAGARSSDVLYDLGCGDGRVLVRAAQRHGIRAIGIEWDAERVELARRRAHEARVSALVEVRSGDVNAADVGDATVVYTYLRDAQTTLIPRLRRELRPGTRLVSREFDYGEWPPDGTDVLAHAGRIAPVWLFRWSI